MRTLNDHELRVLGALIEKQIATPDYYPMTLNALVNACNQKNHRDPVVSYDEAPVLRTIESLRGLHLAFVHEGADARVPKHGHTFPKAFELEPPEVAVMCVLMLRGPQTPGELRSRTPHLHAFESLAAVEEVLQRLSARPEPLVRKLARAPGMKEARYAQLLGGDMNTETNAVAATVLPSKPDETPALTAADPDRVAKLEAEIESLRKQFNDLQAQFAEFQKQFE